MNRFVPLHYEDFKRFVFQLKKRLGLRHAHALELASKACGFQHFHEITCLCREDRPLPVPTTLQCAGDVGFDRWSAQVRTEFGADLQTEMGVELRQWYSRVFEPAVACADWLEASLSTSIAPGSAVPKQAHLPALGGSDAIPDVQIGSAVLVTYKRRRRFLIESPEADQECHEV